MTEIKIVKTLLLKAPPEHVWKFLTEGDKLAEWFHRGAHDLEEGGEYILLTNSYGKEGDKIGWGKVIEMNAPHRLVHSFAHKWLNGVETVCTWTLDKADGGTILTLVHSGCDAMKSDEFEMAAGHDRGWDEHFIRLRRVAN